MSFSYSGDPAGSEIDELRFYLGDTDSTNSFTTDEELTFLYDTYFSQYGHMLGVAALGAEMLAAKFARELSVSADGVSIDLGSLQQRFNDLAMSLRAQYKALNVQGDMDAVVPDLSLNPFIAPLSFGIGFMDNPEAGTQDMGRSGPVYHEGLW